MRGTKNFKIKKLLAAPKLKHLQYALCNRSTNILILRKSDYKRQQKM